MDPNPRSPAVPLPPIPTVDDAYYGDLPPLSPIIDELLKGLQDAPQNTSSGSTVKIDLCLEMQETPTEMQRFQQQFMHSHHNSSHEDFVNHIIENCNTEQAKELKSKGVTVVMNNPFSIAQVLWSRYYCKPDNEGMLYTAEYEACLPATRKGFEVFRTLLRRSAAEGDLVVLNTKNIIEGKF